jgi:hypothetical protein
MLESLHLKNVGPAPSMNVEFARRLNLITGDNGLGKSFLLDVAWWALTRTWARQSILPALPPARGEISYRYTKATPGSYSYTSLFDRAIERWSIKNSRPAIPGLVLYAQVDGGFSVWDPARNYWRIDGPERPSAYLFNPQQVWDGNEHCEGLIRDWGSWQREKSNAFETLRQVLEVLSPEPKEGLIPGELRKLTLDDPKRYPTLRMPYGQDIAVIHASAGMRRIIALAYLLVWAWQEHLAAAALLGTPHAREVIFLIDEIEAHLHPQWQRRIAPAVLRVMSALTKNHTSRVQLITATHSALVLASAEPLFDPAQDAWFDLDLEDHQVILRKRPFVRRGDASNWLTSEAFDLKEARSLEAEVAMRKALELARLKSPSSDKIAEVDALLRQALGDTDRFWVRWEEFVRTHKEKGKKGRP